MFTRIGGRWLAELRRLNCSKERTSKVSTCPSAISTGVHGRNRRCHRCLRIDRTVQNGQVNTRQCGRSINIWFVVDHSFLPLRRTRIQSYEHACPPIIDIAPFKLLWTYSWTLSSTRTSSHEIDWFVAWAHTFCHGNTFVASHNLNRCLPFLHKSYDDREKRMNESIRAQSMMMTSRTNRHVCVLIWFQSRSLTCLQSFDVHVTSGGGDVYIIRNEIFDPNDNLEINRSPSSLLRFVHLFYIQSDDWAEDVRTRQMSRVWRSS